MHLRQYVGYLRQKAGWIAAAALVGAAATFIGKIRENPVYQVETTILIGSALADPSPETDQILTPENLVPIYASLAESPTVLQAAIESGSFPLTVEWMQRIILTTIIPDTPLLVITVSHEDPSLAVAVANEVAKQLLLHGPTPLTPEEVEEMETLAEANSTVSKEIQRMRNDVEELSRQMSVEPDWDDWSRMNTQRDYLVNQIAVMSLRNHPPVQADIQRPLNQLQIIELARPPRQPAIPDLYNNTLLGGITAGFAAFLLVVGKGYINTKVQAPAETRALLGVPVLGIIFQFGKNQAAYAERLVTFHDPTSRISDQYKILRTNLLPMIIQQYRGGEKPAILITSAEARDGKSVTAANLAVSVARAGLRVLLVDADLRRPTQHQIFGLPNDLGLTTLLRTDPASMADWATEPPDYLPVGLQACIQNVAEPNLRVLTSGLPVHNATEFLQSDLMRYWYERLLNSPGIDMILIDTPPALAVADSRVLAATIKVPALLVLRAGRTDQQTALRLCQSYKILGIPVLGTVLNAARVNDVMVSYGVGVETYRYYYGSEK